MARSWARTGTLCTGADFHANADADCTGTLYIGTSKNKAFFDLDTLGLNDFRISSAFALDSWVRRCKWGALQS